jgi:tight adherence protein C
MTGLELHRAVTLALLGAALGLLAYAVGNAPKPQQSLLGLRGYKRVRSLADSAAFSAIEPTMRFISQRMYSLMPDGVRERLEREISMAGNVAGLLPHDLAALTLLSGTLGASAGGMYGYLNGGITLFATLVGLVATVAPYLYVVSMGHERQRRISMSMPQVIDLLSLSLSAGLDFPSSIRQVVERTGHPDEPLYEELRLVLQDLSLGRTRRQALEQLAERAPSESVRDLVGAVVQSEEQGTPLAEVLRVQAASSRVNRSAGAEEAAAKAATKMLLPLVLLFVCVLSLIVGPVVLRFSESFQ